MNKVFKLNSNSLYNLWQILQFTRSLVKSVYHGAESISYLVPKVWDISYYKTMQSLDTFKIKIKKRKPENYSCRLYKAYIDIVGFLLKS